MIDNFPCCCGFTLTQEGGFCNVQGDPGGATNHGVTMAELSSVLGRQATIRDVCAITEAQAEAIYQTRYWTPINGDNLPGGVDLMVFDFGVTSGPGTSARLLQRLIGVEQDGIIGPGTLAALATHDRKWVISTLALSHQAYYESLSGFAEFGAGWIARSKRRQAAALGMAEKPVSVRLAESV